MDLWNALTDLSQDHGDISQDLLDAKDADGETALSLAAVNGHARIVSTLLEKGADDRHCPTAEQPIPMVRCFVRSILACVLLPNAALPIAKASRH